MAYRSAGPAALLGCAAVLFSGQVARADSLTARCDIYPAGSDRASGMVPCRFSQRQGHVVIERDDGVVHDLMPTTDVAGNFTDQHGRRVYRQSGLGTAGLIFRLPDESVYVYWNTSALEPASDTDNPTAPFSTADYDATTLLRCRATDSAAFGTCPAGILRMTGGRASVVIRSPDDVQFTINFMGDYINATNGDVEARLDDDTWIVIVDGHTVYEVPIAAIEGG